MKVQFLKSAVYQEDYPAEGLPEYAIVGRSNAGKSSILNAMYGEALAKVSSTPGKTRLVNFFEANKKYRIVDLPGYGFAARSNDELKMWKQMIETYVSQRRSLRGLLLVMDIRRDWEEEEQQLIDWATHNNIKTAVALNKADKMSKNQYLNMQRNLQNKIPNTPVILVSALKKIGIIELEDFIFKNWLK